MTGVVQAASESYQQDANVAPVLDGDTAPGDALGWDVDLDGDLMVVTLPEDDDIRSNAGAITFLTQPDSGSVAIFARDALDPDAWNLVTKLLPDNSGEQFGRSVAVSGDTVAVGAYSDTLNGIRSGTVYLFQRDQGGADRWGLVTRIAGVSSAVNDQFGYAVDLEGDTLLVGAPENAGGGSGAGAAYVFYRNAGGANNWGQQQPLLPSGDAADVDFGDFGKSVALDGDRAVVGAPRDNTAESLAGAIYLYERDQGGADNWGEVTKLDAGTDALSSALLGTSVAVDGDRIAGGAQNRDEAYLFERNGGGGWDQVKRFESAFVGGESNFGDSVAIDGDRVFVGDGLSLPDRNGTVYIYGEEIDDEGDPWGLVTNVYAVDRNRGMDFGLAIAVDNGNLLAGSPGDDDFGRGSGSSFLFGQDRGGSDQWGVIAEVNLGESGGEIGFGQAVAVSGQYLFVGAPEDRLGALETGSVSVFKRSTGSTVDWTPLTVLRGSRIDLFDQFGSTLDASGRYVVVGAQDNDGERGAHLFERDSGGTDAWGEVAFLNTVTGNSDLAVAVDGDTVALGDWGASVNPSGTVHLFQRDQGGADNWGLLKSFTSSDGESGDQFGWSVAMHGDLLVVGARNDDDSGSNAGAVYVFRRDEGGANNWGEVDKLLASGADGSDVFGESVAIFGTTIVGGAPGTGTRAGAVYIFEIDMAGDWQETRALPVTDPDNDDDFGNTVSLWSDLLVVSSGGWDDPDIGSGFSNQAGAAFVFQRNAGGPDNWGEVARLQPEDAADDDRFTGRISSGYTRSGTVDIDCHTIVGGAPVKDTLNADVGAAYAFSSDALFCGDFED